MAENRPENSLLLPITERFFYMNHIARQENLEAHHHQWLEMAMLIRGRAIHRTTHGDFPCKTGQILIIPPGIWHAYTECRGLELFNCLFSPELIDGALAWTAQDPAIGPLLRQSPFPWSSQVLTWELQKSALSKLRELNLALLQTYKQAGVSRPLKLVSGLLALLDHIGQESRPTSPEQPVFIHSAVRRAAELLRADLARPWTLPGLAAELRINPSYLVRLFRQQTGSTPMKFLAHERANKAAQLLMITDMNVGEIGAAVGWAEPKQFARSFRGHFREPATAFRQRLGTDHQPPSKRRVSGNAGS